MCVVSLSQMLYVKYLCMLSRYLRCYMLNVCVCCPRYLRCYMLNVCVCCLVISDVIDVISDVKCLSVCVVSLSQMLYAKYLCMLSRYLRCYMLNVCVCCPVISDVIC